MNAHGLHHHAPSPRHALGMPWHARLAGRVAIVVFALAVVGVRPGRAAEDHLAVTEGLVTLSPGAGGMLVGEGRFRLRATGPSRGARTLLTGARRLTRVGETAAFAMEADADTVRVAARSAGAAEVTIALALPSRAVDGRRRVELPVPGGAARRIVLEFPGRAVDGTVDAGHQVRRRVGPTGTTLEVIPAPAARTVPLTYWTDTRRATGPARLAIRVDGVARLSSDSLRLRARCAGRVLGGDGRRLTLLVDAGWRIESIQGAGLRGWRPHRATAKKDATATGSKEATAGDGPRRIELTRGGDPGAPIDLTFHLARDLDPDSETASFAVPILQGAERVEGTIRLLAAEGLTLAVERIVGGRLGGEDGAPAVLLKGERPAGTEAAGSSKGGAEKGERGASGRDIAETPPRVTLRLARRGFRFDQALRQRLDLAPHAMRVRGELTLRVRSGSTFRLRARVGGGLSLRDLRAPGLRRWRQQGDLLTVEVAEPIDDRLTLEYEGETPSGADGWPLPSVSLEGAARRSMTVAIQPQAGFAARWAELGRGWSQTEGGSLSAWMSPAMAVLKGETVDPAARIRLEAIPPSLRVKALGTVRLTHDRAHLRARFLLEIRRATIFRHRLRLPPGMEIRALEGESIRDWSYDPTSGLLEIRLAAALEGTSALTIAAVAFPEATDAFPLALPVYRDATRFDGVVSLPPTPGWRTAITPEGSAREIAAEAYREAGGGESTSRLPHPLDRPPLPGERFFGYDGSGAFLTVRREALEPVVTVTEAIDLGCERGRLRWRARLDFAIDPSGGGLTELRLRLPEGFRDAVIHPRPAPGQTPAFRSAEAPPPDASGWVTIRFPRPRMALHPVEILGERPLGTAERLDLRPVALAPAFRIRGALRVRAGSDDGVDVGVTGLDGLRPLPLDAPLNSRATPRDATGQETVPVVQAFSFESEAARAGLDLRTMATGRRREAEATDCRMLTRLAEDGRLVTRLRCHVRNPGAQQYLEVRLPRGAEVLSTFVGDMGDESLRAEGSESARPIKPVHDRVNGRLLVPLTGFNIEGAEFDLEVVYAEAGQAARLG